MLLLSLACNAHEVSRDEWTKMTPAEKDMVVRSLLGGEVAADAKGGFGDSYSKTPEYYRAEIDRRYAAGDDREVNEIWEELKD